jgi:hypothetical protein
VRGLVTPFTTFTTALPALFKRVTSHPLYFAPERPWGSPFRVFSPPRSTSLFERSCPLDVCRAFVRSIKAIASVPCGCSDTVVFRALFPRRIRAVTNANGRWPSIPSWGFSLQSLLSSAPVPALFAGTSPLTFGRANVSSRLGLRVFRYGGVDQPVSGLASLLGFLAS